MALVFNGSSNTIGGLAVGGLPDGIVDEDMIAANAVTAAKIPTEGITTTKFGNHGIIQVVENTYSTAVEITSTTWTDSGLTVNITPTTNTNKILVIVSQAMSTHRNTNSAQGGIKLLRDSTLIAGGTHSHSIGIRTDGVSGVWSRQYINLMKLDDPQTTSQLTYKIQGRDGTGNDGPEIKFQDDSMISTIVVMEVVA
tara:strand:- start:220 stop:810 length:591 start_codon:yes stop_codon:yes gene_type:complete